MRAIGILALLLLGQTGLADGTGVDPHSQKALSDTQQLLRDPVARDAAIKKDPNAVKWDGNAAQAVGSENKQELYNISSDILADLVKQTGGDSRKMMEIMEKAKSNPEAFFNSLSPEQRAKIVDLSKRSPAAQQGQQAPVAPR